jgi:hypothetical protein
LPEHRLAQPLLEAGLSTEFVRRLLTHSTELPAPPRSPQRSPAKGPQQGKRGKTNGGNGNDNDDDAASDNDDDDEDLVEANDDATVLRSALEAVLLRGAGRAHSPFALSGMELRRESMLSAKARNAHRMQALKVEIVCA